MRFVFPWFLLLLSVMPIVGILWVWFYRRTQQRLAHLIAPALQPKLMPAQRHLIFYAQLTLVMLGVTLLIFAVARPQWGRKDEKVMTRGRNIVIALDVSRSMLARDVHPNRLERAKADLMDLVNDLKGDRAALLAFRNMGSLICPLTTDYAFLRQALDSASPESAPRGETNLGDAIRKSLEALDPGQDDYNAILLVSDGEDLTDGAIAAATEAARRNIPIFTVGIGDESGTTIPDVDGQGVQTYKGSAVQTKLVAQTLTAIANASNGRYIPLGTAGTAHTTLGAIYRNHLRRIAAKEQQEQLENRYQEHYQLFLIPALLALLAAAVMSRGRLVGSGKRRSVVAATVLLLSWGATLQAQTGDQVSAEKVEVVTNSVEQVEVPPGREGARQAQHLLRKGEYTRAAEAFIAATRGAESEEAEDYRFNAAYAWYRADDVTNATQTLRMLLNSRRLGARAGELLGKLQVAQAREKGAEEPIERAKALEEAAVAFQEALRATPKDERRGRNFTRAVDPLPEARESAHIAKVLEQHGQTPPDQLIGKMLKEQREIARESQGLHTNMAAVLIAKAEALAERQQQQADLWIPLKQQLLQAVTNQQEQMEVVQQLELARDSMKGSTLALQDLLPEAEHEVGQTEPIVYNFWKAMAAPPDALDEDIVCQSNAIKSLGLPWLAARDSQREALQLTTIFSERFPEWADGYMQQAQSDTNMPPFTAEDKAKIEEIAAHALKLQRELVEQSPMAAEARALQEQALSDLLEIRELLPKQGGGGGQSQEPPPEQQEQEQEQEQEEQQPEQPEEQPEQEEQQQPEPEEQKEQPPQDVQELLRKALEREKEHEERKKERMRTMPLKPGERDW